MLLYKKLLLMTFGTTVVFLKKFSDKFSVYTGNIFDLIAKATKLRHELCLKLMQLELSQHDVLPDLKNNSVHTPNKTKLDLH